MKKYILFFIITVSFLTVLVSCSISGKYKTVKGLVLGYSYQIVYQAPEVVPWTFEADIRRSAERLAKKIDESMSLYNTRSIINAVNNNRSFTVDSMFLSVLNTAFEYANKTGSPLNITIDPLRELWGNNMGNADEVTPRDVEEILQYTSLKNISVTGNTISKSDPRVQLNLNSLSKGYAADMMYKMLQEFQIDNFLIEIGKEAVCKGVNPSGTPWRIIIDNASHDVIYLTNKALSITGNFFNYKDSDNNLQRDVINPLTGYPFDDRLLCALVIMDDCLTASALSNAFLTMGMDKSMQYLSENPGIQALLFYIEGLEIKTFSTNNILPRNEIQYFP